MIRCIRVFTYESRKEATPSIVVEHETGQWALDDKDSVAQLREIPIHRLPVVVNPDDAGVLS